MKFDGYSLYCWKTNSWISLIKPTTSEGYFISRNLRIFSQPTKPHLNLSKQEKLMLPSVQDYFVAKYEILYSDERDRKSVYDINWTSQDYSLHFQAETIESDELVQSANSYPSNCAD